MGADTPRAVIYVTHSYPGAAAEPLCTHKLAPPRTSQRTLSTPLSPHTQQQHACTTPAKDRQVATASVTGMVSRSLLAGPARTHTHDARTHSCHPPHTQNLLLLPSPSSSQHCYNNQLLLQGMMMRGCHQLPLNHKQQRQLMSRQRAGVRLAATHHTRQAAVPSQTAAATSTQQRHHRQQQHQQQLSIVPKAAQSTAPQLSTQQQPPEQEQLRGKAVVMAFYEVSQQQIEVLGRS